jgi:hypothetical protein
MAVLRCRGTYFSSGISVAAAPATGIPVSKKNENETELRVTKSPRSDHEDCEWEEHLKHVEQLHPFRCEQRPG